MRNLKGYEQFMNDLKSEKEIPIVVSKVVSNGIETYTTSKGEKISKNIGEDLQQMADLTLDPSTSNDGSDIKTNPNRTVGTGTYTPNSVDKNPKVKGYEDTADSATQSGVSTLT
jgi:hypothetical protein